MSDSVWPHRWQPTRLPVPGILQARALEWVAISFSNASKWKVKVKMLSCVQLLATPWTAAYEAPQSMGFSRQEYWSELPLPSLGLLELTHFLPLIISFYALLTMPKPLTVWIITNCGKFWKRWEYQTTWPASWEICMQVKKQQLELDMEQQTGSK